MEFLIIIAIGVVFVGAFRRESFIGPSVGMHSLPDLGADLHDFDTSTEDNDFSGLESPETYGFSPEMDSEAGSSTEWIDEKVDDIFLDPEYAGMPGNIYTVDDFNDSSFDLGLDSFDMSNTWDDEICSSDEFFTFDDSFSSFEDW